MKNISAYISEAFKNINEETSVIQTSKYFQLNKVIVDKIEYEYYSDLGTNGHYVMILPFRQKLDSKNQFEYLIRNEICPAWKMEPSAICVTGGIDKDETPEQAAVREIAEETGYQIAANMLLTFGEHFTIKSTNAKVHYFAVDLTKAKQKTVKGDGSPLETIANISWNDDPIFTDAVSQNLLFKFKALSSVLDVQK